MAKRKPDTHTCALYVTEERDSYGEFYHINAYVVTIDVTLDGDRVRNICYSGYNEKGLDGFADLIIRSQGCGTDKPRNLYGFEALYVNAYAVDHARAVKMADTLKALYGKLNTIDQKRGRAIDYADYLGRVGEALKIGRVVIAVTKNFGSTHDDQRHRVMSLGEGIDHVRRVAREWINAGEPAEVSAVS